MINKLRILLLSAAFFCTLVLAPAAFAHTTQAQVSAQPKSVAMVTQPQSKEYDRGWTKGYQDTLRTCLELKQRPRDFAQRRVITAYDRGYYDGSEFALQNSQACRNLN